MTSRPEALDVGVVALPPASPTLLRLALTQALTPTPSYATPSLAVRLVTLADALAGRAGGPPDVLVVALPEAPGAVEVDLVDQCVRAAGGDTPVVVLSPAEDEAAACEALRRGVSGYLLLRASGAELVAAIERVRAGEVVVDMAIGGRMAARAVPGPPADLLGRWQLRPREQQVLERLVAGRSNREIAADLHLGEETVKTHLRSIYHRLGARDRSQAIVVALTADPTAVSDEGRLSGS